MQAMHTTARAIFVELQTLCIVFPVLSCCIGSLLALGAGEIDYPSGISFLCHNLLNDFGKGTSPYRSSSLTNRETQPLLDGNGVNQFYLHGNIIPGHDHFHAFG